MNSGVKDARELVSRIAERRVCTRGPMMVQIGPEVRLEEVKKAVLRTGIGEHEFVANIITLGGGESDGVIVVNRDGDRVGKLTEVSPFIKTLMSVLEKARAAFGRLRQEECGQGQGRHREGYLVIQ